MTVYQGTHLEIILFSIPQIIPPQIQPCPNHDIGYQHHRIIHIRHQQYIDGTKGTGHTKKTQHRFPRRQAYRQQFVVDMVLVRLKRAATLTNAEQNHADHIERRNNQRAESYDEGTFRAGCQIQIVLAVLYGKETERVAQGQASRIAHENLAGTLHTAEHVVIEERYKHTESTRRKHGITPQTIIYEQVCKNQQRHAAQTGSKAVDTVYQIDGIGYEYNDQDSKRHTDIRRQFVYAEQTVQIIYPKPGQREKTRTKDLDDKLLTIADTYKVIRNTHQIEQSHAADKQQQLRQQIVDIDSGGTITVHKAECIDQAEREQGGRKKRHTAKAGNGLRMHLTLIRLIKKPLTHGYQQNTRNQDTSEICRYQKGQDYKKEVHSNI